MRYTASDGSLWHVECICPPVPNRGFDWCASHEDYDGAPDSGDLRVVYGETAETCTAAVERHIAEANQDGN